MAASVAPFAAHPGYGYAITVTGADPVHGCDTIHGCSITAMTQFNAVTLAPAHPDFTEPD